MMDGAGKGHTIVGTYLQVWTYFADSGIPFALRDKLWGKQWVKERYVNVAIHVRKPEYGLRASESFYIKAIEKLRSLTPGELSFAICTEIAAAIFHFS